MFEGNLGVGIDPVQVLENDRDGPVDALANKEAPERVQHPPSPLLRVDLCPVVAGDDLDVEQSGQRGQELRFEVERRQPRRQLLADFVRRIAGLDGEQAAEEGGGRPAARRIFRGRSRHVQHERRDLVQRSGEFQQQPRLADTRLSNEPDDLPTSAAGQLPARAQNIHFRLAPDEARQPPPGAETARIGTHDDERGRAGGARHLVSPELEVAGEERRGHLAHLHHARTGVLGQSIEHPAERGAVGIVDHEGLARLTNRRLFRVDQCGPREARPGRLESGFVEGQRGAHGSPGGVLDRHDSERRVEPRLAEPLDAAAEPENLLRGEVQELPREWRFVSRPGDRHPEQGHVSALPANRSRPGHRRDFWTRGGARSRWRWWPFAEHQRRSRGTGAFEPELSNARAEGVPGNPQNGGGVGDVSARLVKHHLQMIAHRLVQRGGTGSRPR